MKVFRAMKSLAELLLFEHITFPLRMLFVYEVIRYLYMGSKLNFNDEAEMLGTYFFVFILVYVLTSVLDLKRAESSPLFLADHILKSINNDYRIQWLVTSTEQRGVFTKSIDYKDSILTHLWIINENPSQVYEVANSYIRILESMQLPSNEKPIHRLKRLRNEAYFMIHNKDLDY